MSSRSEDQDSCARGACLAALSWDEAQARLARGDVPVLPIGAGAKEHGHHLPLDTDLRQADWLGAAIASRWPALVWPTVAYGHYPAFSAYPGSVSMPADLFEQQLAALLDSIAEHSQAPILVLNTGISTIAPVDAAVATRKARALHVYRAPAQQAARERNCAQRHGGHGDEAETSVMCLIAPDALRHERAQPFDHEIPPGPLSRVSGEPGYTPQGVWGRPDLASAEAGRNVLNAMLEDVAAAWKQLHAD